jgi:hypothetical protein
VPDSNRQALLARLSPFLPHVEAWIDAYLQQTSTDAHPVASRSFPRLPTYFSTKTLNESKVVKTAHIQKPPLSQLGLREFLDFERMDVSGITYKDTFFINPGLAEDESLHFHELIHVIQWQVAGPEGFILAYAAGLAKFGYRQSPLEVMAYDLQDRFEAGEVIPDLEKLVASQTKDIVADY